MTHQTIDAGRSDDLGPGLGLVATDRVVLFPPERPLRLESGRTLAPVEVAYETYGDLAPERDNVVVVCHALTGDAHAAGHHGDPTRRGWWDSAIGPGRAVDTDRYFVVCANLLGGCRGTTGPSSTNPATGEAYGLDFPAFTVGDLVRVQRALLRRLGIDRVHTAIGGSLGGMQVLEWALQAPEEIGRGVVVCASSGLTAQNIALSTAAREAILRDPGFRGGRYAAEGVAPRAGLAAARMLGHVTYVSEEAMTTKFGRRVRSADGGPPEPAVDGHDWFRPRFEVEHYLHHQAEAFLERFDALSYLYLTRVMDAFAPFEGPDAADRLERVRAGGAGSSSRASRATGGSGRSTATRSPRTSPGRASRSCDATSRRRGATTRSSCRSPSTSTSSARSSTTGPTARGPRPGGRSLADASAGASAAVGWGHGRHRPAAHRGPRVRVAGGGRGADRRRRAVPPGHRGRGRRRPAREPLGAGRPPRGARARRGVGRRRPRPLSPTRVPGRRTGRGRDPVLLRTRLLRLVTRVDADRRRAWRATTVGRALLGGVERIVRRGPVRIAGGIGVGLLVPTARLPLDHAQAGLLVRGAVEPPVAEALRRHLPVGGVLWDVGANLGYFALLGARIAGPDGQVVAIDPLPANVEATADAATLNGLDGVHVVPVAAWRDHGDLELVIPGDGAWAHLADTVQGRTPGDRIRVRALPLDDLLRPDPGSGSGESGPGRDAAVPPDPRAGTPGSPSASPTPPVGVRPPDVVKIDVEGAEVAVLDGLERTIADHRPVVVVETHGTSDAVAAWAAAHDLRTENLEAAAPVGGPDAQLLALVPRER
ncbi:MAG: homoserine O-acetyltransferase [Solirubrobacteraceae bacterium]|nr:homoserine O-acetyltransferase [Solirubrobacteraceae bacterium]